MRRQKAKNHTGSRRIAREFAFRILFQSKQSKTSIADTLDHATAMMRSEDDTYAQLTQEALDFSKTLLKEYVDRQDAIDMTLRRGIRGWSFEQMAQTDLNIIRLALCEMVFTETPAPPIIESAVRIARKFGGEESGRFVNGVLASLFKSKTEGTLDLSAEPLEEE
ncbi:MAG: transcription antitermination factor NusB [Deinococcaceae bacterium]